MERDEPQEPCVGSDFGKMENQEPDSSEEYDTDLETENSYAEQYLQAFQQCKSIPLSSFLSNMAEPHLNLSYYGLGPSGYRALATILQSDFNIVNLELEENGLRAEGADFLRKLLQKNTTIQSLNLSSNQLCLEGAEVIAKMLLNNNYITSIKLAGNFFDDCAATQIARALEGDFVVKELDLSHNMICDEEGELLGYILVKNLGLEILNLSWNHICTRGALALCDGLKVNSMLKELQLSWNGFGHSEAEALGQALTQNHTLMLLDLSRNRFDDHAVALLCQGLAVNEVLSILKLSHNIMTSVGALTLLRTVRKNTASALEEIDISTVLVCETFMELLEEARQRTPALQVHCSELTSIARNVPAFRCFKDFLKEQNETILGFFQALDKEGTMKVSNSVFRKAVQAANIPLDQRQVNWMIRDLDKNCSGVINYSRFLKSS